MTTNRDLAIKKIEKDFEKISNLVLEQLQLLEELFTTRYDAYRKQLEQD